MMPMVTEMQRLAAAELLGERAGDEREDAEEHDADDEHDQEVVAGVAEARGRRRRSASVP